MDYHHSTSLMQCLSNKRDRSEAVWGLIFLAPLIVLLLAFTYYPMVGSLRFALYNWSGISTPTQFVGLRHFVNTATDPYFWNAVSHNLIYTAVQVPVQLLLALSLAVIVNDRHVRGRVLLRTIFFIPVVTSVAIAATAVRMMTVTFGAQLTTLLGADPPIDLLGSPTYALPAVIVFGIWYSLGYNLIFFLAALQTVPQDVQDAAMIDGASSWQSIIYVTLPAIRPILIVILLLALLGSMHVFEQSWVLTGGGPFYASDIVADYIYRTAFGAGQGAATGAVNYGRAAAATCVYSILLISITVVTWRMYRWRVGRAE